MSNFICTVSTENTALAPYTGKRYTKSITPITFEELAAISKNTSAALKMLYKIFKGTEPAADSVAMSVKAKDGAFQRFYGPTLCKNQDGLLIFFGNETIPFTTTKGKLKTEGLPEHLEIKLSFEKGELNGYNELLFKVLVFNEQTDSLVTFLLPFRVMDVNALKDTTADQLQTMLERKPAELISFIGEVPQGGSDFDGPLLKLAQLEVEETYKLIGYRAAKPGGRLTFIMQIAGEQDQVYYTEAGGSIGQAGDETKPLTQAEVWCNSTHVPFFSGNPTITPENPGQLLIRSMKKSKSGHFTVDAAIIHDSPDTVSVTEDELDFTF